MPDWTQCPHSAYQKFEHRDLMGHGHDGTWLRIEADDVAACERKCSSYDWCQLFTHKNVRYFIAKSYEGLL